MNEMRVKTMVRIGDMCFYIYPSVDERGLLRFDMEEMDMGRDKEEYVCSSCEGVFDAEELEYLAHRILDAVEYFRKTEQPQEVAQEVAIEAVESREIANALLMHKGDRKKAAEALRMSERTLYRKIKQYDLDKIYGL